MKKLLIIIPTLNEESNIPQVIKKIPKNILNFKTYILVIDDGSTDNTAKVSEKLGAAVISHHGNQGVGKAFQTGLNYALENNFDAMVNIDADGQFNPLEIKKLIKPISKDQADFVVADRFYNPELKKLVKPENMSHLKFWDNIQMAKLISFLSQQKFNDVSCGFRAYNRRALLMLNLTGKFTYTQESFLDLATKDIRIATVPTSVKYFPDRVSRVASNVFSYSYKTLKIIIRSFRDYKPLLFFVYLSVLPANESPRVETLGFTFR